MVNLSFESLTDQGVLGGQTFTLTTGIDNFNVANGKATNGNDTFIATNDGAGTPTLNTGDQIDGGAGLDTLKITSTANVTQVATLSNVEKVQIQQLSAGATGIDAVNWTGVQELANVNSTANVGFTNVGSNAKVSVVNGGAGNSTAVTFADSKLGTDAALSLAVSGSGSKAGAHTITANTGGTDVVKTLNIDAAGANNIAVAGTATTGNTYTTLNVTGEGSLSLTGFGNKVSTVDASHNSGGVTLDLSGVTATTLAVTGSSGKDAITANAASIETIDLGAGNDTLTIVSGNNVTAADTYNGGEGKDTLAIATAANANTLVGSKLNAQFTNFEVLSLTTVDAAIDVSKWGVNELSVTGDVTGASDWSASGFTSGATVTLSNNGDQTKVLNVGIKNAGDADHTNDVLNVNLTANLTASHTYKIGVDSIETLNITASDPDAVTSTGTYTLVLSSATDVRAINVAGTSALTLDASASTQGVTLSSTSTGNLTFTATAKGDDITGGSGQNEITGGNGSDKIDISASAGKQDTIHLNGIVSSANGDTITGFVAGAGTTTDVIQIANTDATGSGTNLFLNATAAQTVVNANQAVTGLLTNGNGIIELGNAALGSNGNLSAATDGTELLKALAVSGTATQITAQTAANKGYLVAYQDGNAYLYHYDAGAGDTAITASEIQLVGTFNGVDAGAFVAGNFAGV